MRSASFLARSRTILRNQAELGGSVVDAAVSDADVQLSAGLREGLLSSRSRAASNELTGFCTACPVISNFWNAFGNGALVLFCKMRPESLAVDVRSMLGSIDRVFQTSGFCDISYCVE